MTDKPGIDSTKPGETLTYFGARVRVLAVLASSRAAIVEFIDGERMGTQATLTFKRLERVE